MSLGSCTKLLTRGIISVVTRQGTAASVRVRFRPPYTRLHTSGKGYSGAIIQVVLSHVIHSWIIKRLL